VESGTNVPSSDRSRLLSEALVRFSLAFGREQIR
jgi:hypothetical protein